MNDMDIPPSGMTGAVDIPDARVELSAAVVSLLTADSAHAQLGRSFVRYARALMDPDGDCIDAVVTADARFHELEAAGLPPGPDGFKAFRRQINAAFPDERVLIVSMQFPQEDIVETELSCAATHLGDLMGIPATGRAVHFLIHTRNRFEGGRMAERWDHMDFAGLLAQLRG